MINYTGPAEREKLKKLFDASKKEKKLINIKLSIKYVILSFIYLI